MKPKTNPSLPGSAGNRLISSPFIGRVPVERCWQAVRVWVDRPRRYATRPGKEQRPGLAHQIGLRARKVEAKVRGRPPITTVLGWSEQPRAPGRRIGVHCG